MYSLNFKKITFLRIRLVLKLFRNFEYFILIEKWLLTVPLRTLPTLRPLGCETCVLPEHVIVWTRPECERSTQEGNRLCFVGVRVKWVSRGKREKNWEAADWVFSRLTGLIAWLTGLFWQLSDGPYYHYTAAPLGLSIAGHYSSGEAAEK